MYQLVIFLLIFKCGIAKDSDNKYIDLLPEEEKRQFLERIARRILEESHSDKIPNTTHTELSDDELSVHSSYVQEIIKEETDNLKKERKARVKKRKQGSYQKQKSKKQNDENSEHVDLPLSFEKAAKQRDRKDTKRENIDYEVIPVEVDYENSVSNQSTILLNTTGNFSSTINVRSDPTVDANIPKKGSENRLGNLNDTDYSTTTKTPFVYDDEALGSRVISDFDQNSKEIKSPEDSVNTSESIYTYSDGQKENLTSSEQRNNTGIAKPITEGYMISQEGKYSNSGSEMSKLASSYIITDKPTKHLRNNSLDSDVSSVAIPTINPIQVNKSLTENKRMYMPTVKSSESNVTYSEENLSSSVYINGTITAMPITEGHFTSREGKYNESDTEISKLTSSYIRTKTKHLRNNSLDSGVISVTNPTINPFKVNNSLTENKFINMPTHRKNIYLPLNTSNAVHISKDNIKSDDNNSSIIIESSLNKTSKIKFIDVETVTNFYSVDKPTVNNKLLSAENTLLINKNIVNISSPQAEVTVKLKYKEVSESPKEDASKQKTLNQYEVYELPSGLPSFEPNEMLDQKGKNDREHANDHPHYSNGPNGEGTSHTSQELSDEPNKDVNRELTKNNPNYVPIYNYDPKHAYYDPYNRYGINSADKDQIIKKKNTLGNIKVMKEPFYVSYEKFNPKVSEKPPSYVPIHTYDPEHAYYHSYNRNKLNIDEKDQIIRSRNSPNNLEAPELTSDEPYEEVKRAITEDNPNYISIYNYDQNHAYYDPYNRYGPNAGDKDQNIMKIKNTLHNINIEIDDASRRNRFKTPNYKTFSSNFKLKTFYYNVPKYHKFDIFNPVPLKVAESFNPHNYYDGDDFFVRNADVDTKEENNDDQYAYVIENENPIGQISLKSISKETLGTDHHGASENNMKFKLKNNNENYIALDYYFGRKKNYKKTNKDTVFDFKLTNIHNDFQPITPTPNNIVPGKIHKLKTKDKMVEKNYMDTMVTVMRDMIQMDNAVLERYDWLGTAVDVRTALAKLNDLTLQLKNNERIDRNDFELYKYFIYLYKSSKEVFHKSALRNTKQSKNSIHVKRKHVKSRWMPKILKKKKHRSAIKAWKEIATFLRNMTKINNNKSELLSQLQSFLDEINFQLRDLYLNSASKQQILQLILHLGMSNLLGLVERSSKNGVEDSFLEYVREERNKEEVNTAKEGFLFVLRILDELK
ncbi:unnamed protein product [Leptidea sinapis]|uniref:Uncharacterized protein n=1 Tax=Leptidea sinapis TaxID=189913 RepID=A0A5E4PW76_9NEOP|nr:unnamed protein product [Leptidea sinapis]